MRHLEFVGRITELVVEWKDEYKRNRNMSEDQDNWPDVRDQEDWFDDFFVWLQSKGYTV